MTFHFPGVLGFQDLNAPKRTTNHSHHYHCLSDRLFDDQLNQVKKLKLFLIEEKVPFDVENSIDINYFNGFRYEANGRSPTKEDWSHLDAIYLALVKSLHAKPGLRRKIRIQELALYFRTLPIVFFSASAISTGLYFELDDIFGRFWFYYPMWTSLIIVWPIFQGGLGACAFLGTSAIIQRRREIKEKEREPTSGKMEFDFADITDKNFLAIRVVLGCLFGFLLGFPFAKYSLDSTFETVRTLNTLNVKEFAPGLVPFMVGFSTNLVLTLLNRLVATIQAIFGLSGRT